MATRTFLFVDQVGSTEQLTRLGDVAAQSVRRALFDTLRSATAVAGGHEVDFTGDGLFCAFEGAADAVDAAVAMQQLVVSFNARRPPEHHLGIRIGLHTGEPLESEGGGYFGAAVVVAARLCGQARPGQVLASGLVRGLVEPRGTHPFEPVGRLELKGVPEHVETFAVGWVVDARRAELPALLDAQRTGPFVGRADELAAVAEAWQATDGGGRQLVLVSGDRGIGVSRLLAEAADSLRRRGASVWAGSGQGAGTWLASWAEAVGSWAAVTPRAELRLALGQRGADLLRLVPALAELVPGLGSPAPMDPAAEVFLVADAVDELAERWSGIEPLVIVLDGMEETDPATLTVLRRVTSSRRGGRVLVLAGYEPSAVGAPRMMAALQGVDPVTELRLEGLPADDVQRLLAEVAGHQVDPATVRGVLAETEGSPYFVVQMARSMQERAITGRVRESVDRAAEARTDLRLRREEITLALRQLDQLREVIPNGNGVRLDPDGTPPAAGDPPYLGLLAFQAEDADVFFGREELVAEMVAALVSSRWLTVVGPSGSGKSSAVRAGLLPALAGGALPDSASWSTAVCTPGPDPLTALGSALAPAGSAGPGQDPAQRLRTGSLSGLVDAGRRLVLVVDQFEELWTVAPEADRQRTLELLIEAAGDDSGRVLVVVCMRADYYGLAAENAALTALLAESHVLVPPMTTAELRAAVELPARRGGWLLEPGLAQAVVDDVEGEPGGLPLLSTAMLETWQRRRGRSLTLAGYAETGGARRAIATMADAALDALSPDQQEVAGRLLRRLAAPAAGGGDVARPAPLTELAVDERSREVLGHLADRRLVIVGATTAQVAHEALLREWPRLRSWLEADRDGRRLHQQVATATTDWDSGGRDDGALLRGARLSAALDWQADHGDDLTGTEREFLNSSAEAQQAELRRARRTTRRFQLLTVGLVVLLIGALVAGLLAVVRGREATQRATESLARSIATQGVALAPRQVDTALLLAVEGYRRDDSLDTRSGLLSTLDAARHLSAFRSEVPTGVTHAVTAPEGRVLAVGTASGEVRLFDTDSWEQRGPTLSIGSQLFSLALSTDGRLLAASTLDGVHLVDVGADEPGPPIGPAGQVEFSSDGRILVISEPDTGQATVTVTVVDVPTRSARTQIDVPALSLVRVRPGHEELMVAEQQAGAFQRIGWDGVPLGGVVDRPLGEGAEPLHMSFTPDGARLAVYVGDRTLHVLDADTLRPSPLIPSWPGPFRVDEVGAGVLNVAPSSSGQALAFGIDNGTVYVVDLRSGFTTARLTGLAGGPAQVQWLDDTKLLTATAAVTVEYDMADDTPLAAEWREVGTTNLLPSGAGDTFLYVDYGADDQETAVLRELDDRLREGVTAVDLDIPAGYIGSDLAVSPDGGGAAVLSASSYDPAAGSTGQSVVVLVDRSSGEVRRVDVPGETNVEGGAPMAFSADGSELALSSSTLRVLDVDTGSLGDPLGESPGGATLLAWAREGRALLVGSHDGELRLIHPDSGEVIAGQTVSPGARLTGLAFLPDGRTLAVASASGQIFFLDADDLTPVRAPLSAGSVPLVSLALSEDGATLAAAGEDGSLWRWTLATGRAAGPPLTSDPGSSEGLVFSRDGRRLLSSGINGVMSWDLSPGAWVDTACRLVGRDMTRAEWQDYLPDQPYRGTCSDR